MLASGLAGRSGRGPAFAAATPMFLGKGKKKFKKGHYDQGQPPVSAGGMGLTEKAGLAALAYLAYKAYQDGQKGKSIATSSPSTHASGSSAGPLGGVLDKLGLGGIIGGVSSGKGLGGGLGNRLAGVLKGRPPEPDLGDAKALLLIRAMITAANADGQITPDEQQRILSSLDAAGAGPDDRRIVEQELRSPKPLDEILRQVNDPETAEQVYLASELAVQGGTETDRQYLSYLVSRLKLSPEQRRQLDSVV
ncbi:tellurite resistance TerB family protein [Skermanella pratensis]|uniref:tellurite resistance TerB family protein n=1 Tax=Skermanella pratensis TaxID=2233999 RepID=UPI001FE7261A|nr:DUF533 domain-containing protein [Skermanella pratensis]